MAVTGVGIEGDILYGPRQVHALVDAALAAGADASYRVNPLGQGPRRLPGGVGPAQRKILGEALAEDEPIAASA